MKCTASHTFSRIILFEVTYFNFTVHLCKYNSYPVFTISIVRNGEIDMWWPHQHCLYHQQITHTTHPSSSSLYRKHFILIKSSLSLTPYLYIFINYNSWWIFRLCQKHCACSLFMMACWIECKHHPSNFMMVQCLRCANLWIGKGFCYV